ncbi:MAG TPA: sigma-70 family RNA polymerase sigma factor [Lacipirellulaceae bacterium]
MQSDAELIGQIECGNAEAFAVLVRRYERLVRAAVLRATHDRHIADDVVQEAFLAAFQSLGVLRDPAKFGPWLLSIARNQAVRTACQRRREDIAIADVETMRPSSNGKLTEPSERLLELVERLPAHERVIIGLKHFEGHSVREISTITGRPTGTVTKQLSRAHKRLQAWLERESKR